SRWNCGIVAHDQLPAQGLATQLTAVVLAERCLKGCDSFRRDASQTLFEAADGRDLRHNGAEPPIGSTGIRLTRDSLVSVMYAEELNSTTSSVTLQRTDRHGILGQKPSDFQ